MLSFVLAHAGEGGGFEFPPLHPIFVNFTAGLVPAALLVDLLGAWLKKDSLRSAGWWTLLMAACLTPVTVVLGWFWMKSMEMEDWEMPYHKWLGISLGAGLILVTIWRGVLYRRGQRPGWSYGVVGLVVLAALSVQGDLGGAMSFGKGVVVNNLLKHHDKSEDAHDHDSAAHSATTHAAPETPHHHDAD